MGVLYGTTSVAVGHPFDTVKTKMQAQAGYESQSMIRSFVKTVRAQGLRGLYRGCIPPLLGSGIFRSTQFAVFEACYTAMDVPLGKVEIPFTYGLQLRVLGGGLVASTARAIIETPLEYMKVRRQVQQIWRLRDVYTGFGVTWVRTLGLMTTYFILVTCVRRGALCVEGGALCVEGGLVCGGEPCVRRGEPCVWRGALCVEGGLVCGGEPCVRRGEPCVWRGALCAEGGALCAEGSLVYGGGSLVCGGEPCVWRGVLCAEGGALCVEGSLVCEGALCVEGSLVCGGGSCVWRGALCVEGSLVCGGWAVCVEVLGSLSSSDRVWADCD